MGSEISQINDCELADALALRYPKGTSLNFLHRIDKKTGRPTGLDFINGPFSIIDETEEDYELKANIVINAATPDNTRRAYLGDLQYFYNWHYVAEPPVDSILPVSEEVVLKFIFHHLEEMPWDVENALILRGMKKGRGTHSLATVKRRLITLTICHKLRNLPDPCSSMKIKDLISAIARTQELPKKSKAITKNVLDNLIATCSESSLIDIRDKALLLFGWASGGRRRSEISDATFDNLEETVDGNFIYHIAKSKTDQIGKGHDVPVKGVAATALREWLKISEIKEGRLFRSVRKGGKIGKKITGVDINRIVKKRCELALYDPSQYSAHSLRRGFVTEAGKQGCPLGDTMALSGHKSVNIAMGYYESGAVINNKAANLSG